MYERKKSDRKYRLKNKEKRNLYDRIYYKKNGDKIRRRSSIYHKNHPEQKLVSTKKYLSKCGKPLNMDSNEYDYARHAWSKTIKKRDNHKCRICNSKEKIHAHHIFYKQFYPELSLNMNNGITLCKSCHTELHGFNTY